MMKPATRIEVAALLPWVGAGLLWFVVLSPLRAGREGRLTDQAHVRRDRLKAEQSANLMDASRRRLSKALAAACRAPNDPAALRQRAIAATRGLSLSPVTLTVSGPPVPGASVEAEGSRPAILQLVSRLGQTSSGSFLRVATLRERPGGLGLSSTTGVFESFSPLFDTPKPCGEGPDLSPPEPVAPPTPKPIATRRPPVPQPTPFVPMIETPDAPPFVLIGFLVSEGRSRVSLRVGDQVRVVSVGDVVQGWKCDAIDRDEGARFTSPSGVSSVLKATPSAS